MASSTCRTMRVFCITNGQALTYASTICSLAHRLSLTHRTSHLRVSLKLTYAPMAIASHPTSARNRCTQFSVTQGLPCLCDLRIAFDNKPINVNPTHKRENGDAQAIPRRSPILQQKETTPIRIHTCGLWTAYVAQNLLHHQKLLSPILVTSGDWKTVNLQGGARCDGVTSGSHQVPVYKAF